MGKHRDWTEIERDYQENGLCYAELAKKHNVPIDTLKKAAARQGWGKHRTVREASRRLDTIEEKLEKAIEEKPAEKNKAVPALAPAPEAESKAEMAPPVPFEEGPKKLIENGTLKMAPNGTEAEEGAEVIDTETPEQRFDRSVYGLLDRVESAIDRVPPEAVQALKLLSTTLLDLQKLLGLNKDELDREEQRAKIAKLKSETRVVEESEDSGVIILPPMDPRPLPPGDDDA